MRRRLRSFSYSSLDLCRMASEKSTLTIHGSNAYLSPGSMSMPFSCRHIASWSRSPQDLLAMPVWSKGQFALVVSSTAACATSVEPQSQGSRSLAFRLMML